MTLAQLEAAFPGAMTAKAEKSVNAQIRRHGKTEAIRKATVYGSGLVESLGQTKEEAKSTRKDRIMMNFASIDGQKIKAKGNHGFSFGTLFSSLLETTGSYVDYHHTRNFPHQVARSESGEWFYHPGVE